jgi:hypothetical protein
MSEMQSDHPLWLAEVRTYETERDMVGARSARRLAMFDMGDSRVGWRRDGYGGTSAVDLPIDGLPLTPFLAFLESRGSEYDHYASHVASLWPVPTPTDSKKTEP